MRQLRLDVCDRDGRVVPHSFWLSGGDGDHLGLVLPGGTYSAEMPLLYYPRLILLERGADVMVVRGDNSTAGSVPQRPCKSQREGDYQDAQTALSAVCAWKEYRRITIVSKSLDPVEAMHLLGAAPALSEASAVWLTPVLHESNLAGAIEWWGDRSLFVVGTGDPTYDAAVTELARVQAHARVMTIVGANRELEVPDTQRSLSILAEILSAIDLFVGS